MIDPRTVPTGFGREGMPFRLRMLATHLASIREDLADDGVMAGIKVKIDATTWMVAWTVSGEALDVEEDLVDLQKTLLGWTRDLHVLVSDLGARRIASEQAGVWSERLSWVAALLEATE